MTVAAYRSMARDLGEHARRHSCVLDNAGNAARPFKTSQAYSHCRLQAHAR